MRCKFLIEPSRTSALRLEQMSIFSVTITLKNVSHSICLRKQFESKLQAQKNYSYTAWIRYILKIQVFMTKGGS